MTSLKKIVLGKLIKEKKLKRVKLETPFLSTKEGFRKYCKENPGAPECKEYDV